MDEWKGDGYFNRMSTAVTKGGTAAEVVHRTSIEIAKILSWPGTVVTRHKREPEV